MKSKLTLRMESDLIEAAKKVADDRKTSLSRLVAEYFRALLVSEPSEGSGSLPPKTRSLLGALRSDAHPEPTEADHAAHLERKYS